MFYGTPGDEGIATQRTVMDLSGTFVPSENTKFIAVALWGAGASGCTSTTHPRSGSGGGYVFAIFSREQVGNGVAVVIGAGGINAGTGAGSDGGDSTFGDLLTAHGGFGANDIANAIYFMNPAGSATALNDITLGVNPYTDQYNPTSAPGSLSNQPGIDTTYGGASGGSGTTAQTAGGTSILGGNGGNGSDVGAADDGEAPGGSGGSSKVNTAGFAGDGAPGRAVIWEW